MAEESKRQGPLHVVAVTYNSADHISDLLASLPAAADGMELRVVVVDNGSADDTIRRAREFDAVQVIDTGANLGYSGGINVARETLGRGDLAILNPDLVVRPGALRVLRDTLSDQVGIVIPRLVSEGGDRDHHLRRESTILGALGDSIFGDHWPSRPRRLTDDLRLPQDYELPRDVAWGGGAAWVVSAECDEAVGAWDSERYFLYSEETDYARRARDLGYRIRYQPLAEAVHHGGGSGTSPALLALMTVNRVRYFSLHHGAAATTGYRAALGVRHLLRAPLSASHRHALSVVASARRWSALPQAEQLRPNHDLGGPHT